MDNYQKYKLVLNKEMKYFLVYKKAFLKALLITSIRWFVCDKDFLILSLNLEILLWTIIILRSLHNYDIRNIGC